MILQKVYKEIFIIPVNIYLGCCRDQQWYIQQLQTIHTQATNNKLLLLFFLPIKYQCFSYVHLGASFTSALSNHVVFKYYRDYKPIADCSFGFRILIFLPNEYVTFNGKRTISQRY